MPADNWLEQGADWRHDPGPGRLLAGVLGVLARLRPLFMGMAEKLFGLSLVFRPDGDFCLERTPE